MTMTKEQYNEKMYKCYVPESTDGKAIDKKAVLGNRKIESIFVPYGITDIGDWAFAHCMKLKEVWLPDTLTEIGREIFQDDKILDRIYLYSKKENALGQAVSQDEYYVYEEAAELTAYAVKCFKKSEYINNTLLFGQMVCGAFDAKKGYDQKNKSWLNCFDEALAEYIREPDDAGFNPFLAGGEEDYEDPENDIEYFKTNQRIKKCGFIFARLKFEDCINKQNISDGSKIYGVYEGFDERLDCFNDYMKNHKEEAIRFIADKKQESYNYLKIYAEHGFIGETDIQKLLDRFSDDDYIESKAYLIKYKDEKFGNKEVWDMFKI